MSRRILNPVPQSECLDFISEHYASLQDELPLPLTRIDRSPSQCIPEPLSTLLSVIKEDCWIKCFLNDLLGLFLVENFTTLTSFIEEYTIVLKN